MRGKKIDIDDRAIYYRVENGETYQEVADDVGCHKETIGRHYRDYAAQVKEGGGTWLNKVMGWFPWYG